MLKHSFFLGGKESFRLYFLLCANVLLKNALLQGQRQILQVTMYVGHWQKKIDLRKKLF